MYNIIVSDLDGTLLTSNFLLTEFTKNVIYKLVQSGIYFVIATGRHFDDVIYLKTKLKIPMYIITSNGARIHNPKNELIYNCNLNNNIVIELFKKYSLDSDILIQLYSHHGWFINKNNYYASNFSLSSSFIPKLLNVDDINFYNFSKIFFTCSKIDKLLTMEKEISNYWKDHVNISFSFSHCLEVMSKNVSKGNALKIVANLLGYSLQNCLAFGDGMNDQEMLKMSGKGIIMGNSHDNLRKNLLELEVIGNNDENAVAIYLNKYFLRNK